MIKTLVAALLLAPLTTPWPAAAGPEIPPQAAQQEEVSAIRDRLSSSLFFRGELADSILTAGMAGRYVNLEGVETNAEARGALLGWIQKNPAKAADVYLNLKGAGGRLHDAIETREMSWKFNTTFIDAIKALNAAAGSSSVSKETLELAARRLYEGGQTEPEGPEVRAGSAPGGQKFFSIGYADYRLNKVGLEKEISQAGAWLQAARSDRAELKGAYAAALSVYGEFVVAASALKGREAVTKKESVLLEGLRSELRSALAALALRSRLAALGAAGEDLRLAGSQPGAGELLDALNGLRSELEGLAVRVESGSARLEQLGGLVSAAENDFAALYLRYSAYDALLSLKRRAARSGFSCLYDYAVSGYLAAFFPEAAYAAARADMAAAAGPLEAALLKAGAGDIAGAFAGLDAARAEAAAGIVRSSAAFNRGAQFFLWGLVFRPVELKVLVRGGRPVFRPAFTFFEVARRPG